MRYTTPVKPLRSALLAAATCALLLPACGGGGGGGGGAAPPSPPSIPFALVSPADGAQDVPVPTVFVWDPYPPSFVYTLQVASDPTFLTLIVNQSGIGATAFRSAGFLMGGATYWWRVLTASTTGSTLVAGPWTFATSPANPTPPFGLQWPPDGAADQHLRPSFAWTMRTAALSYTLQISTSAGFTTLLLNESTSEFVHPLSTILLSPLTTHWWRVEARDPWGTLLETAGPWSFTTRGLLPPVPGFDLLSPSGGAAGVPVQPSYLFSPCGGGARYQYQVSPSSDFSAFVDHGWVSYVAPLQTAAFLTPGASFFWRVFAATEYGYVLAAASPGDFSVEPLQASFHAITGQLRELVHDPSRNRVYVTNEEFDRLEIYDGATNTLLAPLPLPAKPWGLDLTPDGSALLVCLWTENRIAVVDLSLPAPAVGQYLYLAADASGNDRPRTIRCAANGRALFTCTSSLGGWNQVRDLRLSDFAVTVRTDTPFPGAALTHLAASRDRSRIAVVGDGLTGGEYYFYDSAGDAFSALGRIPMSNTVHTGASGNADGSRFALHRFRTGGDHPAVHVVDPLDLRVRATIPGLTTVTGSGNVAGFAFAPAGPRAFRAPEGSPILEVIDTERWDLLGTIPAGVNLKGTIAVDPAGSRVFAIAEGGMVVIPVPPNTAPAVDPVGQVTVNLGETVGITVQAVDPDGDALQITASGLPPNASFNPLTRRLSFAPGPGQVGIHPASLIAVSDGVRTTTRSVVFEVTDPASYPGRVLPLPGELADFAYHAASGRLYASNRTRNRIEVVDVASNTLLDPVPVGSMPRGIDLNPAGTKLVVCTNGSDYLDIVDLTLSPPAVTARVPVPTPPLFSDYRRAWAVGVADNQKALFSYGYPYVEAGNYIGEVHLGTLATAARSGSAANGAASRVRPSADRTRVVFAGNNSAAPPSSVVHYYRSATDDFSNGGGFAGTVTALDTNPDGTRFLVSPGPRVLDDAPPFIPLTYAYSGSSPWAVLRPGTTAAYRLGGPGIEILDLVGFTVSGSFALPDPSNGPLGIGGTRLFLSGSRGLSIVTLP